MGSMIRGWSASTGALALAGVLAAASVPAAAQSGSTRVLVVATEIVASNATYSRDGLANSAAWKVTLSNAGPNTINKVVFSATSRVVGVATGATTVSVAPWSAVAQPIACTTTTRAPATVSCSIGQLRAAGTPGSSTEFVLFFRTPSASSGVAEKILMDWRAEYSDKSVGERIDKQTGTASGASVLDEDSATNQFKGAIAPAGTKTVFTGVNRAGTGPAATQADPWVTFVQIPPFALGYGGDYTATIFEIEGLPPSSGGSSSEMGMQSELTIPGVFGELKIVLRRDVTSFPAGVDMKRYVELGGLRYAYVDAACTATGQTEAACTVTNVVYKCSVSGGPASKAPCIDDADPKGLYIFSAADGLGPEWTGDLQIKIRAIDNGRYIN